MDIGKLKNKKKNKERLKELEKKIRTIEVQRKPAQQKPDVASETLQESSSPTDPIVQIEIQKIQNDIASLRDSIEKAFTSLEEKIASRVLASLTALLDERKRDVMADVSIRYENTTALVQAVQAKLESLSDQVSIQLREIRRDQVCRVEFDETRSNLESLSSRILQSISETNGILEILAGLNEDFNVTSREKVILSAAPDQPKFKEQQIVDILGVISRFQRQRGV